MFFFSAAQAKVLMIDTFNSKQDKNMLGGAMGSWIANPGDESQGAWAEFSEKERFGDSGCSLYLRYDVESREPAFGGYWMKLENLDATPYKLLVFFVKGDPAGYPTKFVLELKSDKQTGRFTVTGVTGKWSKIAIPLASFEGLTDFSALTEFVVVFSFDAIDVLTGAVYIDDLCFSDGFYDAIPARKPEVPADAPAPAPAGDAGEFAALVAEAKKEGLEVRQEKDSVVITVRINFDSGKSNISKQENKKVGHVADILKKHPALKVQVAGHTDNVGPKQYNMKLSLARAVSVANELARLGIDSKRLSSAGKGMDNPLAGNASAAGRAKNRRVEFIIGQ